MDGLLWQSRGEPVERELDMAVVTRAKASVESCIGQLLCLRDVLLPPERVQLVEVPTTWTPVGANWKQTSFLWG